jgi:hypothetical protein
MNRSLQLSNLNVFIFERFPPLGDSQLTNQSELAEDTRTLSELQLASVSGCEKL